MILQPSSGSDDWSSVYYSGGSGNDTITGSGNNEYLLQGGVGNDVLITGSERYHRLEGGPGNDILSASNFNQSYYREEQVVMSLLLKQIQALGVQVPCLMVMIEMEMV